METDILKLSIDEALSLGEAAFRSAGTRDEVAALMARIHVDADRDGIASHGLARVPGLCEQLKSGRVDGMAQPDIEMPLPGIVLADARGGFPQPAFETGFPPCLDAVKNCGTAILIVRNAWAADVMGWHVERFANEGFLAIGFANVPASMAPSGGLKPVYGTNPVSCAIPQSGKPPIIVDQASSVIAKSEIVEHASAGKNLPEGWALDAEGAPTRDPAAALSGSLLPAGGYKGAGIALIVELFTAILSGSELSVEAAPLARPDAPPVHLSQTWLVVDPEATAGQGWRDRVAKLSDAIEQQPGARVPGARRFSARKKSDIEGIPVTKNLLEMLRELGKG